MVASIPDRPNQDGILSIQIQPITIFTNVLITALINISFNFLEGFANRLFCLHMQIVGNLNSRFL